MNKRCTNSACRKVFSTLNADSGCPFCGKSYPQLSCTRRNGAITLTLLEGDAASRLRIDCAGIRALAGNDRKIQAIKTFRTLLIERGYLPGLKGSKDFVEAMMRREKPCRAWRVSGDARNDCKAIEPAE